MTQKVTLIKHLSSRVCSNEPSVNWYGELEQLNSSVNTDGFIQWLISAGSQAVHGG